jgi:NitT/TauT family transport system ATP-binding protein
MSAFEASATVSGRDLGAARTMLEVRHLRHVFGSGETAHVAIGDLNFSVREGELVSIVGPSGAGKTTLLRCLSGLLQPTDGTVTLLGTPVAGVPDGIAMVFQDYSRSLFPWLKVAANVAFPLKGRDVERGDREARVGRSLEAVGLGGSADRYPWQLSGGMQQRVAIARALAYQPRLLLMDEPFASVDAQTRSELEDLVLTVARDFDVTIVFVTHDIDESIYLADRVLVLSRPPACLVADIEVDLPAPRDQITTKELDRFVELRSRVARLIRGHEDHAHPPQATQEAGHART